MHENVPLKKALFQLRLANSSLLLRIEIGKQEENFFESKNVSTIYLKKLAKLRQKNSKQFITEKSSSAWLNRELHRVACLSVYCDVEVLIFENKFNQNEDESIQKNRHPKKFGRVAVVCLLVSCDLISMKLPKPGMLPFAERDEICRDKLWQPRRSKRWPPPRWTSERRTRPNHVGAAIPARSSRQPLSS